MYTQTIFRSTIIRAMKNLNYLLKVSLVSVIFLCFQLTESKAQSNWEVGLRFGEPSVALDATIPLATAPRLHTAIYMTDVFGIGGYFDWMFSLDGGPTGLKFYPGVGPEFFFGDDFHFVVSGDFGAEYSFDFPLTVFFDWRPGFVVTNEFDFRGDNIGIGARFRFGEGVRFQRE